MNPEAMAILRSLSTPDWIAILGILGGFVTFVLQRARQALSYRVGSIEPDPEPAQNGAIGNRRITIWISNSGNTPLLASEFLEPITIQFLGSGKVTKAEPFHSLATDEMPVTVRFEGRTGIVEAPLLNPGEQVAATFSVMSYRGEIRVRARLPGVRVIHNEAVMRELWLHVSFLSLCYGFFLVQGIRGGAPTEITRFLLVAAPYLMFAAYRVVRTVRDQQLGWGFRPYPELAT